ncbi:MAG: ABC transporter ATP-binding protein [Clostridia bacterium]|nr:ABC transporter ATP-binding protein [Clostridia bacterium]
MDLLRVEGLCKRYEGFYLDNVSFALKPGYIMGFIGRNGAGKSTTIKAILNLINNDGGKVYAFGLPFYENETECKQKIGYVSGGFDCYKKSTIKKLTSVTRRFYKEWDEQAYEGYVKRFGLDENKKISELSAGMRVKYALALALCHNARLLILDEPTSGLDPVSRDDLLDVFRQVISDGEHSILFSTHIISDLEKCADHITYIKDGKIISSTDVVSFREGYRLVSGESELLEEKKPYIIGHKSSPFGFTALIRAEDAPRFEDCRTAPADLESIMIYTEQED